MDLLPVAVHCVAEEGDEPRQSHLTIGIVEKQSDGQWALKAIKQKLFVDGLCYLLQEIYGIENKVCRRRSLQLLKLKIFSLFRLLRVVMVVRMMISRTLVQNVSYV